MCVNCLNYEEGDRPQGRCSVTKVAVLAWYGCTDDCVLREEEK